MDGRRSETLLFSCCANPDKHRRVGLKENCEEEGERCVVGEKFLKERKERKKEENKIE